MPKKARRAIGCPRAKKKKVDQAEAVDDEADDLEEGDEAEEAVPSPPPEPVVAPLSTAVSAPDIDPFIAIEQQMDAEGWEAMRKAEVVGRVAGAGA